MAMVDFRSALTLFRWAAYGGAAAAVLAAERDATRPGSGRRGLSLAVGGLVIGLVVVGIPWRWGQKAVFPSSMTLRPTWSLHLLLLRCCPAGQARRILRNMAVPRCGAARAGIPPWDLESADSATASVCSCARGGAGDGMGDRCQRTA